MSEGARLRGDGVPIVLVDGEKAELVFDFDAICELETQVGSLRSYIDALYKGSEGPFYTTVAQGVAAGVRHSGARWTVDEARMQLDGQRITEYGQALDDALSNAMPDKGTGKGSAPETPSRGPTTTTSAPSASGEPTPSSGE